VTARASVGKRRWDEVSSIRDDGISLDDRDWLPREGRRALSRTGIAEQNRLLLRRYRDFRLAADAVVASWRHRAEVVAVALLGSVAARPWQEVPRFAPFRRARIALWHECKDLDLALWLAHLRDLDGLRRAKDRALRDHFARTGAGVASHQVDVFVLEPETDRYLGRLCQFNRCPKGKNPNAWCRAAGRRRSCASTRVSAGSRKPWPGIAPSACSIAPQGRSVAPPSFPSRTNPDHRAARRSGASRSAPARELR